MSSRLLRDTEGRLFCEVTVPRSSDEYPGKRWKVLENAIVGAGEIGFLEEKTGRPPEAEERQSRPEGRHQARTTWPKEFPARARGLHEQGLSCKKVAERLDVPWTTVKCWLWPAGHDRQRQKRKEAA